MQQQQYSHSSNQKKQVIKKGQDAMSRIVRNSISGTPLLLLFRQYTWACTLIVCTLHLHLHLHHQGAAAEANCNSSRQDIAPPLDIVQLLSASHRKSSFFAHNHVSASHADEERGQLLSGHSLALGGRRAGQNSVLTSSHNPEDDVQLEAAENFFYKNDRLQHMYSVSDYGFMALVSRAHAMTYGDLYMHLYDTHTDLKRAASPTKVNRQECLRQLESLVERVELQEREKYYSKDLNLYQLLDTWGHVSSGILLGNVFFAGMYNECKRLRINQANGLPDAETRYCVLTAKHVDWPKAERNDILALKAGVCLPAACDSSTHDKRKEILLMRLVDYHLRRPEEGQVKFSRLYCLPDEDSPSRSLWQSRGSSVTLVCLCLWLALLAFATYKHSRRQKAISQSAASFGLTNVHCEQRQQQQQQQNEEQKTTTAASGGGDARAKVYQVLSIAHNLRLLFDTSKESSLMETGERMKQKQGAQGEVSCEQPKQQQQQQQLGREDKAKQEQQVVVDLRCIEGIKVIAMSYVIMGHVLMCLPTMMVNAREFSAGNSLAFFMANLVPAFAVNSFFTITGLLTCYLIFKQNQGYPFITSPAKWFAFIVYRYLRIMPLYALVVLYCKTLAKFTGSGPLWDYGTSSLSQRRVCEQEPWDVTLMFKSNLIPPLEHCIPGGWYLSNDFQFFLVTPLFLALLHKRPQLGRLVLLVSIVAGYLAGFQSIYGSRVKDLRPIANFAPHGFKTYVSHFSFNYTRPQYRIPAYLIGLLMGHQLFLYETAKRAAQALKVKEQQLRDVDDNNNNNNNTGVVDGECLAHKTDENGNEIGGACPRPEVPATPEPDWSEGFKRNGTLVCLIIVIFCCITPMIGAQLPFNLTSARIMVSLITPTYHVLFSLAVGLYLLLATTGNGSALINRWLAKSFWKPLARLSLCAVLVNVEVINHFVQTNTTQQYVDSQYHMTLNCLCIVATYAVSTLVCVLFEAPIRGALNGLLTMAITKVAAASAAAAAAAASSKSGKKSRDQKVTTPAGVGGQQAEKVKTC